MTRSKSMKGKKKTKRSFKEVHDAVNDHLDAQRYVLKNVNFRKNMGFLKGKQYAKKKIKGRSARCVVESLHGILKKDYPKMTYKYLKPTQFTAKEVFNPPNYASLRGLERSKGPCFAQGTKHDGEKTRFDLLPASALDAVAKVLTKGAAKYGDRNWEQGIKFGRLFAATQGRLNAWWLTIDHDAEWGFLHLAHAACCVLMLLHYALQKKRYHRFDDRPRED